MSGINCLFCEYIGDLIGLRQHSAECPNHPLRAQLAAETSRRERAEKNCDDSFGINGDLIAERDALAAQLADLRNAAGKIHHWHDWGKDNEGMVVSRKAVTELWDVTAATPQQSLARIKAEALREAAGRCTAIDGGTPFIYQDQLEAEADRLAALPGAEEGSDATG